MKKANLLISKIVIIPAICLSMFHAACANSKTVFIILTRHGETEANVMGILAGSATESELTETGILMSEELGQELSDVEFSSAYCSDLKRTKNTAEIILNENSKSKPGITIKSGFNDIYWGNLEQAISAEVFTDDAEITDYLGTVTDSTFVSSVGAESLYSFYQRFDHAMNEVIDSSESNNVILIVSHAAAMYWINEKFGARLDSFYNDNFTLIKVTGNQFELLDANDVNHSSVKKMLEKYLVEE